MTFDARAWFCSCSPEDGPHTPECDSDAETARQIYDAGLARAEEIARGAPAVDARSWTVDSIAAERARLAGEREAGR